MADVSQKEMKKMNKGRIIHTETLLRDTSNHYIRLIGDSDRKARIMIVVNSLLLTAGITIITKVFHQQPLVWISPAILVFTNLVALFFTIMSVKPDLHGNINQETEDNMLHYKKCMEFGLADYVHNMLVTMRDNDKKIDAVIKELYYFGNLLGMKYKLMKVAYRFFLWGVLISITSYLAILFLAENSLFQS